jgi:hypothetical protein
MFCPQCQAEYRPGFTHCSDCEVELVECIPERPVPQKADQLTSLFIFAMHQFIAMCGSGFVALLFGTSVYDEIYDWLHWHPSFHYYQWVLSGTPYYPLQIAVGLYIGWALYRRFQHRAMFYVWILPFVILCYAILTFAPQSVLVRPGQTSISHYFGWDCLAGRDRCLDQLVTTMPFYGALAYSIGAGLAKNMVERSQHNR